MIATTMTKTAAAVVGMGTPLIASESASQVAPPSRMPTPNDWVGTGTLRGGAKRRKG
jgi:hypothetical protein